MLLKSVDGNTLCIAITLQYISLKRKSMSPGNYLGFSEGHR